jgi:serine/threonine protein phosphatase PrpC
MSDSRESFGFPLSVGTLTDVGCIRTNNEDSVGFHWLEDTSLFVIVADGMGGHEAGEVASSLAVRVVEDAMARDVDADPRERIFASLLEANAAILDEGGRSGTRGMGTTAITCLLKGNQCYVGMIGDSRCYHFRRGHMIWRTSDHTRVQMLLDQGKITSEDARSHPEAGMLTRALGHSKMADGRPLVPDVIEHALILDPHDTLVLSSDGLHDLVDDWEIARAVADKDADAAAAVLVAMACERGGHDNITVAVINAGPKAGAYDPNYQPDRFNTRLMASGMDEDENVTFDEPQEATVDTVFPPVEEAWDAAETTEAGMPMPIRPMPVLGQTGVVGRRPGDASTATQPLKETSGKGMIVGLIIAGMLLVLFFLMVVAGIGALFWFDLV